MREYLLLIIRYIGKKGTKIYSLRNEVKKLSFEEVNLEEEYVCEDKDLTKT